MPKLVQKQVDPETLFAERLMGMWQCISGKRPRSRWNMIGWLSGNQFNKDFKKKKKHDGKRVKQWMSEWRKSDRKCEMRNLYEWEGRKGASFQWGNAVGFKKRTEKNVTAKVINAV